MTSKDPAYENTGALPNDSNYKGNLPSQKYFTPQELNNLGRVGKTPLFPRPASGIRSKP